jgi:hypothetical protein
MSDRDATDAETPPGKVATMFVLLCVVAFCGYWIWDTALELRLWLDGDRVTATGYCRGFPVHRGADCVLTLNHPSVRREPTVLVNLTLAQMARIGSSISAVETPVELMWIEGKPETARAVGPPLVKGIIVIAALVLGARMFRRRARRAAAR